MVKFMDKKEIIRLKENGLSNREVARQTGYDRETVSKYWRAYKGRVKEMEEPEADVRAIQEALFSEPKYDASNRKRYKYTEELDARLKAILKEEAKKDRIFGVGHKQKLTNKRVSQTPWKLRKATAPRWSDILELQKQEIRRTRRSCRQ